MSSKSKTVVFRVLAGLVALTLTLFGGQYLFSGWTSPEHAVHELGWGVAEGLLVVVALVSSMRRPQDHPAAMQQVVAVMVALGLTMVATAAFDTFTVVLFALVAVMVAMHPARGEVLRLRPFDRRVLVGACIVAVALVAYGLDQAALQRGAGDAHAALDHYTGMTAAALALALVAGLAAVSVGTSRLPAWTAGVGAGVLGVASIAFPDQASSLGVAGGALMLAGAAAFVVLAEVARRGAGIGTAVADRASARVA